MLKYEYWLGQAKDDLEWGRDSLKTGHPAQACFIAQQVGEKAIKALAFARGAEIVKSHSIRKIASDLNENGEIIEIAASLDLYYMPTRYPDALPEMGLPSEHFTTGQAEQALKMAERLVGLVEKKVS